MNVNACHRVDRLQKKRVKRRELLTLIIEKLSTLVSFHWWNVCSLYITGCRLARASYTLTGVEERHKTTNLKLTMSCCVPEIFAINSRRCNKSRRNFDILGPPNFGRGGGTQLWTRNVRENWKDWRKRRKKRIYEGSLWWDDVILVVR